MEVKLMALERRQSERKKSKLRLAISGVAGGGKTYSALLIAYGITGDWTKITIIDTENNSADLYADLGKYNVIELPKPFTPEKYTEAIHMCEDAGDEIIIVDSLTHAWAGEGGLLEQKGKIEDKTGNGWTAWRSITPQHNRLVETILQSSCHIICTLRAKMDYVQEKDPTTGKTVIRKVGMGSIQRDGMEYEFTVFFDIDQKHNVESTKDRTKLFDGQYFVPTTRTGKLLKDWLEAGTDTPEITDPKILLKGIIKKIKQTANDKVANKTATKEEAEGILTKYKFTKIGEIPDVETANEILDEYKKLGAKTN
jgi:hypothetical protein